ncbi:MAG TPA: tetratricopeptide repeat protein [Gemmatimonadaceae bacterium]|nr:tetratricopeptide repeat protein [Gemmatimonadaceae bacterium]
MSAPARIEELKKRYDENPHRFFAPLANEYRKSGDLEQAIFICETHLAEKQGTLNGHVVYGQALFEAGRLDESKKTFETALTFDPENLISLRHLGDIARTQGDSNEARQWYTRVLDADPRNHEIIAFLAELPAAPRKTPPGTTSVGGSQREQTPTGSTPATPILVTSMQATTPTAPQRVATPTAATPAAATPATAMPAAVTPAAGPSRATPATATATPATATPTLATPLHAPGAALPAVQHLDELLDLTIDLGPETPVAHQKSTIDDFGDVEILFTPPSPGAAVAPPPRALESPSAFAPEPTPTSTPAAPTGPSGGAEVPADFLFGDTPFFAEGGQKQPHSEVDSFMGRTPALGIDVVPKANDMRMPFVTETMAELYLQQGFREEGIAVYRQLLDQNPGDTTLQQRVTALTSGSRSSIELDWQFDDSDAAAAPEAEDVANEAEPRAAEVAPDREAAFTPTNAQAAVDPVARVPAASEPQAPAVPEPQARDVVPPTPPFSSPEPRTARELFGALATRRAVKRDPTLPTGIPVAPAAPTYDRAPLGTIDTMFGEGRATAEDERVASSLASAAAGLGPAPDIKGKPTQPAATELSLDAVFRTTPMGGTAATPGDPSSLSFDQFFGNPASMEAPQSAAAPPPGGTPEAVGRGAEGQEPPPTEARSAAELEQFQDWLQQLKKP